MRVFVYGFDFESGPARKGDFARGDGEAAESREEMRRSQSKKGTKSETIELRKRESIELDREGRVELQEWRGKRRGRMKSKSSKKGQRRGRRSMIRVDEWI